MCDETFAQSPEYPHYGFEKAGIQETGRIKMIREGYYTFALLSEDPEPGASEIWIRMDEENYIVPDWSTAVTDDYFVTSCHYNLTSDPTPVAQYPAPVHAPVASLVVDIDTENEEIKIYDSNANFTDKELTDGFYIPKRLYLASRYMGIPDDPFDNPRPWMKSLCQFQTSMILYRQPDDTDGEIVYQNMDSNYPYPTWPPANGGIYYTRNTPEYVIGSTLRGGIVPRLLNGIELDLGTNYILSFDNESILTYSARLSTYPESLASFDSLTVLRQCKVVIRSADDITVEIGKEPLSSIDCMKTSDETHNTYYDLLGYKIENPIPGSLYISNGKKVIFRK